MSALPDQLPRPRSSPPRASGNRRGTLNLDAPLLRVGAGLGLAGVLTGLILLIFACAGFDAALDFCPAVIVLGTSSLLLSTMATVWSPHLPDSTVLASLFTAGLAILVGVLELTAWLHWPIMFTQH